MERTEINSQWMMMIGLCKQTENKAQTATGVLPRATWNMWVQTNAKLLTCCATFESVLI